MKKIVKSNESKKEIEVIYFSIDPNNPFYNNSTITKVNSIEEAYGTVKASDDIDGFWLIKRNKKKEIEDEERHIHGKIIDLNEIKDDELRQKLHDEGTKQVIKIRDNITPFFPEDHIIKEEKENNINED